MQRLTARLLLLLAIIGTFIPLALAAIAPPLHACCLRKGLHQGVHQCHGSAPAGSELSFRDAGCCNHDCGRTATTSQWATPQVPVSATFADQVAARLLESRTSAPLTQLSSSHSSRAPPRITLS